MKKLFASGMSLLVFVVIACVPISQPTPTPSPTPTPTATAPPSPTPTPTSAQALPDASVAAMKEVESYHFEMEAHFGGAWGD